MMNTMKEIIREYMSTCPAFWFSYSNCWRLIDRLADENGIRLNSIGDYEMYKEAVNNL